MHSNKNTESNYFLRGVSYICTVCRFCKNDCKLFLSYKVLNFFFHTTENNWKDWISELFWAIILNINTPFTNIYNQRGIVVSFVSISVGFCDISRLHESAVKALRHACIFVGKNYQ